MTERIFLMLAVQHGNPLALWFVSIEGEYIMIAKIVSGHGTGSAASAIRYVSGDTDHKGNKRDEVVHLFGDGQQIIDLTESMTCKHTYLSSVLSFAKEESAHLSLDTIHNLAAEFAKHHAEPMGINSIAGCAYLHIEDGRYDVHLIQAQLDMESGKRVDLYLDSCGDTQRIADWQDCKNYELKLDDPRDPSRMRLTNDKVRESKNREEMRAMVNKHLLQKVIDGETNNRVDVVTELQTLGFEVMRQNKKSISIKSPDLNQNIRLTGVIFNESFTGIEGIESTVAEGKRRNQADHERQYESAYNRLASSNKKRTERISKKLNINLEERSIRTQGFDFQDFTPIHYSCGYWLPDTWRSWDMGNPGSQYANQNGNAIDLPDSTLPRAELRHRAEGERNDRQQRQLLDKSPIEGENHATSNHEIPNYRTNDERTKHHAGTMRGLSACSQEIEQASQGIGIAGATGGSMFGSARRTIVAAIECISGYLEKIALKLKHAAFPSRVAQSQSEQNILPPDDDMGLG